MVPGVPEYEAEEEGAGYDAGGKDVMVEIGMIGEYLSV